MYPLLKLAGKIAQSNVAELQVPYRMTYALTYRCQLTCTMCGIWKRPPSEELTLEQITDFFRSSGRLFSWINLSGGEIFIRKDLLGIMQAIDASCRNLYLLNFPTNGYETDLITETVRQITRSFRFPRVLVTVSLDGDRELHDRIRGVPGAWDRAVETYTRLRRMRSSRFDVYLGMTLQSSNVYAFDDTVKAVQERISDIRFRDFHVNIAHVSKHYYGNEEHRSVAESQSLLSQLRRIEALRDAASMNPVQFLEKRYQGLAATFLRTSRTPLPCQALAASFFMDPSGTVYPCTIYGTPIGNIRDSDYRLLQLWNSGQRPAVRQEIRAGNCPQCWTPCEAYQSILARMIPFRTRSKS